MWIRSTLLKNVVVVSLMLLPNCKLWSQIIDTVYVDEGNKSYSVANHPGSTYFWTIQSNTIASGQGTSIVYIGNWTQPGLWMLKVVEQNQFGCYGDTVNAYVYVKAKNFKVDYPKQACIGDSVVLTANGGSSYLWNNGTSDSVLRVQILSDTTFTVMISNGIVSDTFTLSIKAFPKPVADFTASVTDFYTNQRVYLTYFGSEEDRVLWEIRNNVYRSSSHTVSVSFPDTGYADIKLIVTTKSNCKDTLVKTVYVSNDLLFIPNVFTPNGDGNNDVLIFSGNKVKEFSIVIYNRWGQKVFETNDINQNWDAKFNGKPVVDDVYTYICNAKGDSGRIFSFSGNVTVLH